MAAGPGSGRARRAIRARHGDRGPDRCRRRRGGRGHVGRRRWLGAVRHRESSASVASRASTTSRAAPGLPSSRQWCTTSPMSCLQLGAISGVSRRILRRPHAWAGVIDVECRTCSRRPHRLRWVSSDDRDSGVRLAEVVAPFSLATDVGMGQPVEHVLRSWVIATRLGDRMGIENDDAGRAVPPSRCGSGSATAQPPSATESRTARSMAPTSSGRRPRPRRISRLGSP